MGKIIYNGIDCGGGSGGGVNIEPNPSEAATDTLEKLGIDGTIYNFEGTTYTAGTNIQINENVISATDTTYSAFQGTDGTEAGSSGLVPPPAATDTNKYLKSDGTWATVSGGGGIGGSSVYSEKVLWQDASGVARTTVTLNDSILNYDLICIVSSTDADRNYKNQQIIPISQIDKSGAEYLGVVNLGGNVNNSVSVLYVDETHLNLSSWASANPIYYYKIVGLKLGTQSPIIYSTEEREVGVWIDNKPLYQITYDAGSNIDVKYDSWTNITINELMGSENIVMGYGTNSGGTYTPLQVSWTGSVGSKIIQVQTPRNSNNQGVRYFTILYTKSADTAGSGSYNTLGVPTVHYSTDEQVIGTWIDGKPLYQKTVVLSSISTGERLYTLDFVNVDTIVAREVSCIREPQGSTKDYIIDESVLVLWKEGSVIPQIWRVNADNVQVSLYSGYYTPTNISITLKYTKTTD